MNISIMLIVGVCCRDIDLLKCRSFAVSCRYVPKWTCCRVRASNDIACVTRFTDAQVLSPEFKEELKRVVEVTRPFVHGCVQLLVCKSMQVGG